MISTELNFTVRQIYRQIPAVIYIIVCHIRISIPAARSSTTNDTDSLYQCMFVGHGNPINFHHIETWINGINIIIAISSESTFESIS